MHVQLTACLILLLASTTPLLHWPFFLLSGAEGLFEAQSKMADHVDTLALVWMVPFGLCSIGLCLGFAMGNSTVAASQMLIAAGTLGLMGTLVVMLHWLRKHFNPAAAQTGCTDERPGEPAGAPCRTGCQVGTQSKHLVAAHTR